MKIPTRILPVIVFSQFCCTSVWFAGNAVMTDLVENYHLTSAALGHLTSAIQFGFISGTLLFAILTIADRYAPSSVFFASSIAAAIFNIGIIAGGHNLVSLLTLRFFTGFFLAGIYPVGMKIAADYYDKGLGKSLGYLVGALVLGTAFPHFLKGFSENIPWRPVLLGTSSLSVTGGVLMIALVPDGPYRKPGQKPDFTAFFSVFNDRRFRSAAFGYFGHMWELYAFWAFVPVMLLTYTKLHPDQVINIPLFSFLIIGLGGLACVIGAYISGHIGTKKTAFIALLLSGLCCLISPLVFMISSKALFLIFMVFWGMVVIADSPLFSTLVAQNARPELKGTALTIVNCTGFAITIVSIQLINCLTTIADVKNVFLILALGPILGLIALYHENS